jgi:hypothetical protein
MRYEGRMDLGRLAHAGPSPEEKRRLFWCCASIVIPIAMGLLRMQDLVVGGVGPASFAAFAIAVVMFLAPPFCAELLVPQVKYHFDLYRVRREEAEVPNRQRQELLVLRGAAREAAGKAAASRHRIADIRRTQAKIAERAARKVLADPYVQRFLDDGDSLT